VSRVRDAWGAWVALWDRRESPHGLAMVRILLGACLVGDLVNTWARGLVSALYSTAGYANLYATGWSRALGDDPGPIVFAIAFVAAIAMMLGVATRVSCVVFALASAQLGWIAPDADRGIDMIARIAALILALSQSHAVWSVDAIVMRRLGKPMPAQVPAWPRYLLLLQLVWIYFSGGINKSAAAWGPTGGFRALENIVTDPHLARLPEGWIAPITPLARIATAATIAFELGAPVYVLAYWLVDRGKRAVRAAVWTRRVWIALGISFHVGIAITLRLGMFPYAMLALYPALLRPEEIAWIWRGRQRRNGDKPANRASSPS
jgi:hypothetical protein